MTEVEIERAAAAVVVARPLRDIDAANAEDVRLQLAATVDERSETLVLDLGRVEYVDSAGVDMIFRLAALLADRRSELRVVIPESSPLRRLAEIVSLPGAMALDATLEEAIAASSSGSRGGVASPDAPQ